MTWWLLIILILTLGVLAWVSALHLALLRTVDGSLEHRLAQKGRLERVRWLIGRQREVAAAVACDVAFLQSFVVALMVVELCGIGDGAQFTFWRALIAFVVGALLIWLTCGVLAPALSRYAGLGIITSILGPLRFGVTMGRPILSLARVVDEAVRRLSGANMHDQNVEAELLRSVEKSQRTGELDDVAAEMIENVVEFADTDVSSVMTPRTEIEGIEYTDDLTAIRVFIEDAGHSRIPVYSDNLDSIEGILYVKDLIRYLGEEAANFKLRPLLRETLRVPETKHVGDLLRDFQTAEIHMAVVVDEYGGTSGLITIEDVLEEIVGEIHDEHEPDDDEEATCAVTGPDTWEADGRFPLHDLEDHLVIDLPDELEPETVAGFVLEHFGRVPDVEEFFDSCGYRFSVLEASDTRVDRVRIRRLGAHGMDGAHPQARSA